MLRAVPGEPSKQQQSLLGPWLLAAQQVTEMPTALGAAEPCVRQSWALLGLLCPLPCPGLAVMLQGDAGCSQADPTVGRALSTQQSLAVIKSCFVPASNDTNCTCNLQVDLLIHLQLLTCWER